ncbi:MAG: tRNA uridine-5-carboxymethylaminomethyl(34) synthesis GTPase MnmE [Pseudomonadota bacterium]
MSGSDTICALASGPPPAALAVIRVSGPQTQDIAKEILKRGLPEPRHASLDRMVDPKGSEIDEVLAIFMKGPASFTGEDVLELTLHGGAVIVERALAAIIEAGARLAEPGEFTRRAFEAGRLDLTKAEAIADLIEAESEAQLSQALKQYDGALADVYDEWRTKLTNILALLEASIDFPDEDDAPDQVDTPTLGLLSELQDALKEALQSGHISQRIRDGFRVAIVGAPNAGKSTLLNQLAGREAAIVTDIPGTTRDIVEIRLMLGGYLVWVSDTAGLRDTSDPVEREGVRRARRAAEEADVRIWLYDASESQSPDVSPGPTDLVIANKVDTNIGVAVSRETICISAKTGDGVATVIDKVKALITKLGRSAPAPIITRARHRQGIEAARASLSDASRLLERGEGAELAAEEVRRAAQALASLTGDVETEAVLGAVFSQFCIGK